jgi:hypothetical protein
MVKSELGAVMDTKKFKPPRNLKETKVWQETIGAAQHMWSNYVNVLGLSFSRMERTEQCSLILKLSQIITIGVAALATSFFYPFLPLFVRVIALPAIIISAWFIGSKVVSPVIIKRVEKSLNPK